MLAASSASASSTEAGDVRTLRVVLLGAEGALGVGPGKSALVERFLSGKFAGALPPTKVAGVRTRPPYVLKGHPVGRGSTTPEWRLAVQLVELPSARHALAGAAPVHLPTADAVVFVYDCADRRTFDGIEPLRALAAAHARPEVLRAGGLLLGTKADLERDRKVAALDAVRLGQRLGFPVFECSAMSGINVEAALASLVRRTALRLALTAATPGSSSNGGDLSLAEATLHHIPVPPPLVPSPELPTDAGGASVSLQDDAFTLLHHACALGAGDAVRALLLRKGADANPHDARGRTPLHIAVLHAHVPCVRALLRTTPANTNTGGGSSSANTNGTCEVTAVDGAGRSPLALAGLLGNQELTALLGRVQAADLYVEAVRAGAAAPFKSRVSLLGSGGAGKTALWRALRGLPRKDPATGRSPPRTLLFEESRTTLGALERQPDPHEGSDADEQILTPNSHALIGPSSIRSWQRTLSGSDRSSSSSSASLDDSGEYGLADGHGACAAFTVQLIQTLLGMRGRQQQQQQQQQREEQQRQAWAAAGAVAAGEAHPLASPHLYPNASEEEAGEVAIHCCEIAGGADAEAVPLQPLLLEGSDVVVLCFDLVRAQLNREEALRDLAYWFAALDSQEHRPGTPRAGVVSPGRQGGKGAVFHRRDILLVGTFRDALSLSSNGEGNDADADAQRARLLEELSLGICQRLAHHEAFARLRVPSAARARGRVFFAVGADPAARGDELGSLRRALCKAVARNGALRRSRPAMWLRFLDEIRCVPQPGAAPPADVSSPASPSALLPPPTGPSPYRRVLSREQCRQAADRLAYEYTNRPVRPEEFALMIRLLGEMGEVMVLDLMNGAECQQVVLPRREYAFHVYRKIVEKCREAELSPRRRAAAAAASSSPLFSDGGRSSPTPADLYPAVQRLRATGRITVESLRALLGPEDGAFLEVALCAFERVELGARLPPTDTDNGEPDDEVFLPGIPIAQSEDDFAVAALLDSPAGAMCDSAGGKVACYYAFREGRLPKGLLARLLLAGMRPTLHSLGGLRFTHRLWGPPSTLAQDHAELPLDGYTLALTVDRAQSRLRCALLCQAGRALAPGMEAQVGLIIYDLLEALRKHHHARFRLDLLVADRASRRAFELVGDVLVAHKRRLQHQQHQQQHQQDGQDDAAASPRPAPDAASPDPRPLRAPQVFSFGQGKEEAEEEERGGGDDPVGRVLHWAAVMTTVPASAFRPLPRALSSSAATEAGKGGVVDGTDCSWVVQPLIGPLSALLPPTPDPAHNNNDTTTPAHQLPQPHILAPHPGGPRRRNKASAYAALLPPDHPAAAHALWRLEPVAPSSRTKKPGAGSGGGFRLRLHRPGDAMDGWGLGLSSSASEKRHLGQIYAVLCADTARAAVFSSAQGPDNAIRLRWGEEYRFLTEGAHDARLPEVRFLVLTPEAALRRSWGFDPLEPSAKPTGPTVASLLSADDAEEHYHHGSSTNKPQQHRSSRTGSLAKPPPAVVALQQLHTDEEVEEEGEEQDALALRPQESAGDEEDDEGEGEANSPEIRGPGLDIGAAAALRDVASALALDDGED